MGAGFIGLVSGWVEFQASCARYTWVRFFFIFAFTLITFSAHPKPICLQIGPEHLPAAIRARGVFIFHRGYISSLQGWVKGA